MIVTRNTPSWLYPLLAATPETPNNTISALSIADKLACFVKAVSIFLFLVVILSSNLPPLLKRIFVTPPIMAFVQASLFDPATPLKARQDALKRALSDPGIPTTPTSPSFWLKQPHQKLAKAQSLTLPSQAEIVIIGSGITGTSIARTLLKESRGQTKDASHPKIVILEARDICSGATGRNGGHILETVEEFADFEAKYGLEAAKKITRFRLAHLPEILNVADEYGLTEQSQTRQVQFLSAYFDEEKWQESVRCIWRFKECMPEEAAEWKIFEREDIPEVGER